MCKNVGHITPQFPSSSSAWPTYSERQRSPPDAIDARPCARRRHTGYLRKCAGSGAEASHPVWRDPTDWRDGGTASPDDRSRWQGRSAECRRSAQRRAGHAAAAVQHLQRAPVHAHIGQLADPCRDRRKMGVRHQGLHQVGMPACLTRSRQKFQTTGCSITQAPTDARCFEVLDKARIDIDQEAWISAHAHPFGTAASRWSGCLDEALLFVTMPSHLTNAVGLA